MTAQRDAVRREAEKIGREYVRLLAEDGSDMLNASEADDLEVAHREGYLAGRAAALAEVAATLRALPEGAAP